MQSGRSMVEMLGVLAIVGVLSVGGVAGFKNAMDKNRANTVIHEAQKRAVLVASQIQLMGTENPSLNGFINNNLGYAEFDTKVYTKADNLPDGQFGIKVSVVSQDVCQKILKTIGNETVIRRLSTTDAPTTPITTCGETNTFLMVYNNDMSSNAVAGEFGYDDCPESFYQCSTTHSCVASETDCPAICELNQALSSGCVCPEHRDRTDDKCGDCVPTESYVSWNQPVLHANSGEGYGTITSAGYSYAHYPWCAFDGGTVGLSDKYLRAQKSTWLQWELPTLLRVSSFDIYSTDDPGRFPRNIIITASEDGADWDELVNSNNHSIPSTGNYVTFNVTSNKLYKYLKWTLSEVGTGSIMVAIGEIKITAQEVQRTVYTLNNSTGICEVE